MTNTIANTNSMAYPPIAEMISSAIDGLSACGMLVATLRMPRSLPAAVPSLGSTSVMSAASTDMYRPKPTPLMMLMRIMPVMSGMISGIASPTTMIADAT